MGAGLPAGGRRSAPSRAGFSGRNISVMHEPLTGRRILVTQCAEFAAYLCSDAASCFVGQVFPVCGGWVTR